MLNEKELHAAKTVSSMTEAEVRPLDVVKLKIKTLRAKATLHESIRKMRNLQVLNASGIALRSLPPWIGELPSLQVLNLCENSISALPPGFASLAELHTLDIGFNSDLRAGLEHIGKLSKLRTLRLGASGLSIGWIGQLAEIRSLQINSLAVDADLAPLCRLSKLESLTLNGEPRFRLPSGISALSSLTELNFFVTSIASLPDDFDKLPALKTFSLTGLYQLTLGTDVRHAMDWGQIFGKLASISTVRKVDLHEAVVEANHPAIGTLRQITSLNLSDFRTRDASTLAPELANLVGLRELTISEAATEHVVIAALKQAAPNLKIRTV